MKMGKPAYLRPQIVLFYPLTMFIRSKISFLMEENISYQVGEETGVAVKIASQVLINQKVAIINSENSTTP